MSIFSQFTTHKRVINEQIQDILKDQRINGKSKTGKDITLKLQKLSVAGKSIRGCLYVFLSQALGHTGNTKQLHRIAAALELACTGILIQDDLMDGSLKRRGLSSIHKQYTDQLKKEGVKEAEKTGESIATCIGDATFFIFIKEIASSSFPDSIKVRLVKSFSSIFTSLSIAQADDVYYAVSKKEPSKKEIIKLYIHKTAYYTFVLPFSLAAATADKHHVLPILEKLGVAMGIIFQIRDDIIDMFSSNTGKPIGGDIRQNKKTLLRYYVYKSANSKEVNFLRQSFGNEKVSDKDIANVKCLVRQYGVLEKLEKEIEKQQQISNKLIQELPIANKDKKVLSQLTTFLSERNK